ncbi:MAG: DNA polymerase III subunit epsilon [Alphaproteobacteria bacterium]|nr:DNA polymerase III subunit epsilon [Alphaproteobacteria bacterium]
MREVVIDTETTGLDPSDGHRIVEIAGIELMYHVPSGRQFHCYVNPERDMPEEAFAVHGLTRDFLAAHPPFAAVIDELIAFIGPDRVVIHNAEFDLAFLNAELARMGRPPLALPFVDTLELARTRFPGAPASLDALCRRFSIDLAMREKHGAHIDCNLLAAVYLELLGGRQPDLDFSGFGDAGPETIIVERAARAPRPHAPSPEELTAHLAMLETIKSPLWLAP